MARTNLTLALSTTAVILALVLGTGSISTQAQTSPFASKYFSSYARAHRVTIRRNGVVVATFETPAGMLFSVYSDQPPVRTAREGTVEFHGNVEIRTRPHSEIDVSAGPRNAEVTMADAPVVIAAQGVDVLSETIVP
jgi:hypothetical protein